MEVGAPLGGRELFQSAGFEALGRNEKVDIFDFACGGLELQPERPRCSARVGETKSFTS